MMEWNGGFRMEKSIAQMGQKKKSKLKEQIKDELRENEITSKLKTPRVERKKMRMQKKKKVKRRSMTTILPLRVNAFTVSI